MPHFAYCLHEIEVGSVRVGDRDVGDDDGYDDEDEIDTRGKAYFDDDTRTDLRMCPITIDARTWLYRKHDNFR